MTWDRDSYDNGYNAGYQVGFKSGYEAGAKDVTACECGFSRDACAANPCLRKKAHLAGLTPGSRWPEGAPISQDSKTTGDGTRNGRTTQPELTGSPCGTPQRAGNPTPEGGVIKNGRYFNTGKTYWPDGTLKFDFDASNARDPWFNGTISDNGFINDYD